MWSNALCHSTDGYMRGEFTGSGHHVLTAFVRVWMTDSGVLEAVHRAAPEAMPIRREGVVIGKRFVTDWYG